MLKVNLYIILDSTIDRALLVSAHTSLCMHFKKIDKTILRIHPGLQLINLDFAWTNRLLVHLWWTLGSSIGIS